MMLIVVVFLRGISIFLVVFFKEFLIDCKIIFLGYWVFKYLILYDYTLKFILFFWICFLLNVGSFIGVGLGFWYVERFIGFELGFWYRVDVLSNLGVGKDILGENLGLVLIFKWVKGVL